MKKWLIVLAVLMLASLGAYTQWPKLKATPASASGPAARPTTAVVQTRSIHFSVSAAGEIGPAEQVSVRPEINGRIETLPVDIGDAVKKGQVLFTLNDQDLQIERSSRLAEIAGARLQVDKGARDFRRAQELIEARLISQELFDDTRTSYQLATNSLQRSEQNLRLVEDRLSKTKIVAPFDCTVLTRPVSIGQAVSGAAGFNSGTEVLTIADLNQMIVNAHVNQADVTRLSNRQEVEISIESVPGLKIKGQVERIAPQAMIKNGVKGYPSRILIKEIDPRVRPGMTANVSVPVASSENTVAVPLAAVFTEQGERFVLVQKADSEEFEKRPVRIGISDYDYAEVIDGLKGGEVVSLETKAGADPKAPPGKPAAAAAGRAASTAAAR